MSEHPSVEELLKSLRETVEKRAQQSQNTIEGRYGPEVLDLGDPINSSKVDAQVVGFLNQVIERVVFRVLLENQHLIKDSVEKLMFTSNNDIKEIFSNACFEYFESRADFEPMVRDIIEKKISRLLRS